MTFLQYATLSQIRRLVSRRNASNPNAFEAEIRDLCACLKSLRNA